ICGRDRCFHRLLQYLVQSGSVDHSAPPISILNERCPTTKFCARLPRRRRSDDWNRWSARLGTLAALSSGGLQQHADASPPAPTNDEGLADAAPFAYFTQELASSPYS